MDLSLVGLMILIYWIKINFAIKLGFILMGIFVGLYFKLKHYNQLNSIEAIVRCLSRITLGRNDNRRRWAEDF